MKERVLPEYSYHCSACGESFSRNLPIEDRNEPQACSCGETAEKVIAEGVCAVLRGDSWSGKAYKLRSQMAARRSRVGRREIELKRETNIGGRLVPNVGGEQVDSWNEAAKLAGSQGKDTIRYEELARKEKTT